jgi:hypothetical protein
MEIGLLTVGIILSRGSSEISIRSFPLVSGKRRDKTPEITDGRPKINIGNGVYKYEQ